MPRKKDAASAEETPAAEPRPLRDAHAYYDSQYGAHDQPIGGPVYLDAKEGVDENPIGGPVYHDSKEGCDHNPIGGPVYHDEGAEHLSCVEPPPPGEHRGEVVPETAEASDEESEE